MQFSRSAVVVWAMWGCLTVAGLVFVAVYGRNCPLMDEWAFLDAITGVVPARDWVFAAHGEHRYPIPRLLFIGLFRLFGDLRAAMAVNVAFLSASAFLLVHCARFLRGRTALVDVAFPILLLSAGHWENVLMAYQLNFTGGVLLAVVLVSIALRSAPYWGWPTVVVGGLALVLLPGFGVFGVVYATLAGIWLGVAAVTEVRRIAPAKGVVLGLLVLIAALEVGACVLLQPPSAFTALPRQPIALARFATRLPAIAFGPGVHPVWPVFALAGTILGLGSLSLLIAAWRAGHRLEVLGLGVLQSAGLVVLAGVVWGRGWAGPEVAFQSRYAVLAVPIIASVVLIPLRFPIPGLTSSIPRSIAILAILAWPLSLSEGIDQARRTSSHFDALAREYREGWPVPLLIDRHDWQVLHGNPEVARTFHRIREIGGPEFSGRVEEVRTRVEPFTPRLSGVGGAEELVAGRRFRGRGSARVRLAIDNPRDTVAIRITGRFHPTRLTLARFRAIVDPTSPDPVTERFQIGRAVAMAVVIRGGSDTVDLIPDVDDWDYEILSIERYLREPLAK